MEKGILYLCATPIGNLEDITFRAIRILKEVDLVAAEDTRRTIKLLNHYNIKVSITSYHKFNIQQKTPELIKKLKEGLSIALVSDAGLPGISDPGTELVAEAIKNNITVVPIPGASALTTALVASGLDTNSFIFYGFLPSKNSARKTFLEKVSKEKNTLIFYESPHRLLDTLEIMHSVLGNRQGCVARELTKKFEEFSRGSLSDLVAYYKKSNIKGEITLLVAGADDRWEEEETPEIRELLNHVDKLISDGTPKKEALRIVAKKYNLPRRDLYQEYEKR